MPLYSRCNRCGGNIPYKNSYCDKCKPKAQEQKRERWRQYNSSVTRSEYRNTRRWRKLRAEIIDAQKGLCLMCYLEGEYNPIDHVHHITEAQEDLNLFYDKDNLVGLCEDHHKFIHSKKILGKEKFEKYLENLNKNYKGSN